MNPYTPITVINNNGMTTVTTTGANIILPTNINETITRQDLEMLKINDRINILILLGFDKISKSETHSLLKQINCGDEEAQTIAREVINNLMKEL